MKKSKSFKNIISNTLWTIRLIFKFNPLLFSSIFCLQILAAGAPFLRNKVFSQLLDTIVYRHQDNILRIFSIFIFILVISTVFYFLQTQFSRILDTKLQSQLRIMFINKVSQLDYQHLEGKKTGNLISKVDEEFGWRIRQSVQDISNIFSNLISLIAVTIIIVPRYPQLWLLIFVSQIPQYLVEKFWIQKDWQIREANSDKNKMMWDLNYQLRSKNYISELRINNAINYLFQKYQDILNFFTSSRIELRIKQSPSELSLIALSVLTNGICLYVLISDAQANILTIGLFTFFFQTIQQTSDFFRGLVYSSVNITENSYHIGNFRKVMDLKNIINGGSNKISPPIPTKIEFQNVTFRYPGSKRYVYKNLNLTINSNEEIAIVGQNGAGKSTLIKLLCHFYEPNSGRILVNGIDLKEIDLENWYQQLSYLAQEFNHYQNLSLRENVSIGRPQSINDNKIINALKKADAQFINTYPQGLDTPMSHRYGGEEPSWGQMQKIAIARVFYRDSPIILLDEPTASIDAISESKIFNRLYKTVKNKTLIIVSHRFSTVRNAQRIIVIDKGKIVEQGSHRELLKLKGLYAKSFNLQAKGYQEA
ncbi:MAG: ABC transporter ATP-binding protein [Candidatus Shapirobacteria bacterium]|nr:ABC transporter ATP-binding protein [Candidatus Woesebacteria bacterium]